MISVFIWIILLRCINPRDLSIYQYNPSIISRAYQEKHFNSPNLLGKLNRLSIFKDSSIKSFGNFLKPERRFLFHGGLERRLLSPINRLILSLIGPRLLRIQVDMMLQAIISEVIRKLIGPVINNIISRITGIDAYRSPMINALQSYSNLNALVPNNQIQVLIRNPNDNTNHLLLINNGTVEREIYRQLPGLQQQLQQQIQQQLLPLLPSHLSMQVQQNVKKLMPTIQEQLKQHLEQQLRQLETKQISSQIDNFSSELKNPLIQQQANQLNNNNLRNNLHNSLVMHKGASVIGADLNTQSISSNMLAHILNTSNVPQIYTQLSPNVPNIPSFTSNSNSVQSLPTISNSLKIQNIASSSILPPDTQNMPEIISNHYLRKLSNIQIANSQTNSKQIVNPQDLLDTNNYQSSSESSINTANYANHLSTLSNERYAPNDVASHQSSAVDNHSIGDETYIISNARNHFLQPKTTYDNNIKYDQSHHLNKNDMNNYDNIKHIIDNKKENFHNELDDKNYINNGEEFVMSNDEEIERAKRWNTVLENLDKYERRYLIAKKAEDKS